MDSLDIVGIVLLAVSLSLDAFSVSLALGLNNRVKNGKINFIILIGLFHLIFPLIANVIGNQIIFKNNLIDFKYLLIIVLIVLLLNAVLEKNSNQVFSSLNNAKLILIAFLVSIDSFSVGLCLSYITTYLLPSCIIFSLFSMIFTTIGLNLGNIIEKKAEKYSKIMEIIFLMVLIIYYICK